MTSDTLLARIIAGNPSWPDTPPKELRLRRRPHRFAPLSRGRTDADRLICGYHGLGFDFGGRCVHDPHGDHVVPANASTRAFPPHERHLIVCIWLGNETPQSEDIPDFSILDTARPNS